MRYLLPFLFISTAYAVTEDFTFQDNSDNEDGFIVERSVNDGEWVQLMTLGANVTEFSDNVPLQATVRYRVYAFNAYGDSGYSNEAQIITIKPRQPSGLGIKKKNPLAKIFNPRNRRPR